MTIIPLANVCLDSFFVFISVFTIVDCIWWPSNLHTALPFKKDQCVSDYGIPKFP